MWVETLCHLLTREMALLIFEYEGWDNVMKTFLKEMDRSFFRRIVDTIRQAPPIPKSISFIIGTTTYAYAVSKVKHLGDLKIPTSALAVGRFVTSEHIPKDYFLGSRTATELTYIRLGRYGTEKWFNGADAEKYSSFLSSLKSICFIYIPRCEIYGPILHELKKRKVHVESFQ